MRICFINPHSDPLAKLGEPDSGGQCIVEKELMKYFVDISPNVTVDSYTRWWGEKPKIEKVSDRARVVRIEVGGFKFIPKEELWEHLPVFVENMIKFWKEHNLEYDVYHAHYADGGRAAVLTIAKEDAPMVFTAHSLGKVKQKILPDENKFRYSVRIPAEEETLFKASIVIALNKPEAENYEKLYDIIPPKLRILPNGVDAKRFKPAKNRDQIRKKLGWDGKKIILTIGRIDPRKGFPLFARAASEIVENFGNKSQNIKFLFPGGGESLTSEEKMVVAEIKQNLGNATNNSEFFPKLSDEEMLEFYQAADLFVCPSPYEPFGLVVIEAMSSGLPVIAFKSGGPAEIINSGIDGELADIDEPNSLAKAITKVINNDELRTRMSKMGRIKVEEKYSWGAIARQTFDIYQEVISAHI